MTDKDKSDNLNKNSESSKTNIKISKKDIEKSIRVDDIDGTEAYYSNRYGWTLRKTVF